MSSIHRSFVLAAALALAVAAAPLGGASAAVLAPYDGAHVAQWGGVQAWSQPHGKDRYVLVIRHGGRIEQAPVPAQRVPFLVSLGDDASGHLVAVYPRCLKVSGFYDDRCRLVSYEVGAPRERAIAGTHVVGASEDAAALDHGILAFARRTRGRSVVLIRRLSSRRPARIEARIPVHESYVTSMALSHRGLAFAVDVFPDDEAGESRLYLELAGRPAVQVARGGFGEENRREQLTPSFAGRYLYWGWANESEVARSNGWVARCDLSATRTTAAAAPGYLGAMAADLRRPAAPLLVTSYSQETDTKQGVDQTATLDAPAWVKPPPELGLAHGTPCPR